ncbi:MAG: hypothetical protein JW982_14155 [Spirochaetes bacterium]|nr:hypothetical protein [Spirochaetota bacterium]
MFNDFNFLDYIFFILAVFSSVFFILRVIVMIVAGGFDADASSDVSMHSDISSDGAHSVHADNSDSLDSFHILSINSITAFIMIFGWIGLAAHRQFLFEEAISVFFAFLAGMSAMIATAYVFKFAMKLASSGSVFNINDLVGKKGNVYQRIDAEKGGKIQITSNDEITREIDAVSYDNSTIESFCTVEVVEVINNTTVAVIKI